MSKKVLNTMTNKIGRNDLCPCGGGKKYKKCCISIVNLKPAQSWVDDDGTHVIASGERPSKSKIEQMTKEYQNKIRNSPMWNQMVSEYGVAKAEELLKEFKAEIQ
jgi:hypothetical protein